MYPGTPARIESSAITPIEGSTPWSVVGKPRIGSQRYRQVAPLSLDGRTAYVVRSTMKLGSFGPKTSWLAAGKRPLARDEPEQARTTDAAPAARRALRICAQGSAQTMRGHG